MGKFSKAEIEGAFQKYWRTGAVDEDWDGFANYFTQDAALHRARARNHGRPRDDPELDQADHGGVLRALHRLRVAHDRRGGGRVVVYMQNRRDHPSGVGTIDFPGITILEYAGDGLWKAEEDYWAVPASRRALKAYAEASQKLDPDHKQKHTRNDWGNGPAWTRGAKTWFERARSKG